MLIRRLAPKDAKAFKSLRLEGLKHHPEAFGASYDEEATQPLAQILQRLEAGYIFGGYDSTGKLQGVIGLRTGAAQRTMHIATIWGMYVSPDMRGTGIAKDLLQTAVTEARNSCTTVRLSVVTSNEPAKRLYERAGFKTWAVDTRALCVDNVFFDELLMRLDFD